MAYLSAVQWTDHLLFFLLGILLPAVLFVTGRRRAASRAPGNFTTPVKLRLYYGNGLLFYGLAGLVLLSWWFGGRAPAALGLGWGRGPYPAVAVVVLVLFILGYFWDLYRQLGSADRRREAREELRRLGFLPVSGREYVHWLFLAVAAGVGEEIVYRGFLINYLLAVLPPGGGGRAVALLLPALSFGLGHFYQGGRAVVKIVCMALIFGYFFLVTGTLWPLILLHAAVDTVAGLLSWYLLGRVGEEEI